MRPYPYGFVRDPQACNADLVDIYEAGGARIEIFAPSTERTPNAEPLGVRDLSGNSRSSSPSMVRPPPRPAMMGAWWQPSRTIVAPAKRPITAYKGRETGFRCCDDRASK